MLAGLSAALPRVVDAERLVMANSLSPTAGTLAATAGGGLAFMVRLSAADSDARGRAARRRALSLSGARLAAYGNGLLGPDPELVQPRLGAALAVHRARAGGRAAAPARAGRAAARALTAMTLMRFCYGALTVMVLMLCRYAWSDTASPTGWPCWVSPSGSPARFFAAAVITPWAVGGWAPRLDHRLRRRSPPFSYRHWDCRSLRRPMLVAAFVLGLITQGAKIATDTVVQSSVDDAFRGRVFSLYDVLFNVAFVGAAAWPP